MHVIDEECETAQQARILVPGEPLAKEPSGGHVDRLAAIFVASTMLWYPVQRHR